MRNSSRSESANPRTAHLLAVYLSAKGNAGIVHENVDRTAFRMQPLANGAQIVHRRDIHRVTERRSACVANDLDRFVKTGFIAIGGNDLGPDGGEAPGEFAPQAA